MPVVNREVVLPVRSRARVGADHRARPSSRAGSPTRSSSRPRRTRRCASPRRQTREGVVEQRHRGRADRLPLGRLAASSGRSRTRRGGTRFVGHRAPLRRRHDHLGPEAHGARSATHRCAWRRRGLLRARRPDAPRGPALGRPAAGADRLAAGRRAPDHPPGRRQAPQGAARGRAGRAAPRGPRDALHAHPRPAGRRDGLDGARSAPPGISGWHVWWSARAGRRGGMAPAALVTGAAGGIGRATARTPARRRLRRPRLRPRGRRPHDPRGQRGRSTAALERFGRLDVVVANAGFQHVAPVKDFPEDRWDALLAILLTSPFLLAKYAWDALPSAGHGRFIAVARAHALVASPVQGGLRLRQARRARAGQDARARRRCTAHATASAPATCARRWSRRRSPTRRRRTASARRTRSRTSSSHRTRSSA